MTIRYTCLHCGKQGEADDQFAGQTGPCAACGQPVSIPFAVTGVQTAGHERKSGSWSLAMILMICGGLFLLCCGAGSALLLPAVMSARHAARRTQSANCLRQFTIALHNYHDVHRQFPPAVVTDQSGQPLYSGRVLLLPFMEQGALYERFDKSKAWDSPENLAISQTPIKAFESPFTTGGRGRCDFVFVTGAGTAFPPGRNTRIADCSDGTVNTILVVETKAGPSSWAAPGDWDATTGSIPPGYSPGQTQVGFADGSVRTLVTNPPFAHSRALTTIAGGEVIP